MLKKSVMIPIKYDEEDQLIEVPNAYNMFKRGVMEFDDYNYTLHNPYVLVENPKYAEDEQAKTNLPVKQTDRSGKPAQNKISEPLDPMDPTLSQKNVNNSITEEY